jgi:hypothetical protein
MERRLAERRFWELASAVREHEASFGRHRYAMRREDGRLHRRLRQISGEQAAET